MRLTVSAARPQIAKAANLCESDPRVISYINRAVQRLLPKGLWTGTVKRYRICTNASCLTWPRQIETIEAIAIDGSPRKIRDEWFEFLEAGPGIATNKSGNDLQLEDRGQVCSFNDITANSTTSYIRMYNDLPESSGKVIILQGYDDNGNWIRTLSGSTWIDGEKVAIPTTAGTYFTTTKKFSSLEAVIKDPTNGVIRGYEYNGTNIVKSLFIYEPDETLPSYRRSFIPQLNNIHASDTECPKVNVVIMGKLSFYEVAKENDWILIPCIQALVEETRALRMFDAHLWAESNACESKAVSYLQEILGEEEGDGTVGMIRVENSSTFGAASVENAGGGSGWGYWQ
jgi:hypothetical protein